MLKLMALTLFIVGGAFMVEIIWLSAGILSPVYFVLLRLRLVQKGLLGISFFRFGLYACAGASLFFYAGHLLQWLSTLTVRHFPHASALMLNVGEVIHNAGLSLAPAFLLIVWFATFSGKAQRLQP